MPPVSRGVPGCCAIGRHWNFLSDPSVFRDVHGVLPAYLKEKAFALLDERQRKIGAIASMSDLTARQDYWRERMWSYLGERPERTPLNARVVGTLDRGDYRIEKIIFESRPGFYVTANLYLPAGGRGPYPAILFPLGHETRREGAPGVAALPRRAGAARVRRSGVGSDRTGRAHSDLRPGLARFQGAGLDRGTYDHRNAMPAHRDAHRAVHDLGRNPRPRLSAFPAGSGCEARRLHGQFRRRHAHRLSFGS